VEASVASRASVGSDRPLREHPLVRRGGAHPLLTCWAVAVLLGILSGIVWPTIPSYDPFSWVVWGHAVFSANVPFNIGNGPSWKPLPFFFTAIYGRFGSAAPWLWVVTARIGGIAGLLGAARLCFMLCRRAGLPAWAAPVASLAAIAGIVLSWSESLWTYYFFRGTSEVFLIGVWLWAIERLFCRRHGQAYTLLALEGWMRPEAWPFLFVYGIYLFLRHPRLRFWVVLGLISQPAAWFGPPWISNGQPFLAASHASEYNGDLGASPFRTVVSRGESLQPLPSLVLAVVASFIGLWQGRGLLAALGRRWRQPAALLERLSAEDSAVPLVLTLAGLSAAWWVVVVVETEDHYPGLQRFFLPAAAMICVLSGYALVQIAVWIGRWVPARRPLTSLAGLIVALIMCVGSWHWLHPRWTEADEQEPLAAAANARIYELGQAIQAAGGLKKILPCASSVVTVNHSLQTATAWELGTDLQRVDTVLTQPGLAFVGPSDSIDGIYPPIRLSASPHFSTRIVATVGAWSVQQVFVKGSKPGHCVGS
jgi:hypothetical protein